MRLAEADAAVQEQGIIDLARGFDYGERRRMGKPVGRAHDEILEGVFLFQGRIVPRRDGREMGNRRIGRGRRSFRRKERRLGRNGNFRRFRFRGKRLLFFRIIMQRFDEYLDFLPGHGFCRVYEERYIVVFYVVPGKFVLCPEGQRRLCQGGRSHGKEPALMLGFRRRIQELVQHFSPYGLHFFLFHEALHLP